jgi:hypothetical protein
MARNAELERTVSDPDRFDTDPDFYFHTAPDINVQSSRSNRNKTLLVLGLTSYFRNGCV